MNHQLPVLKGPRYSPLPRSPISPNVSLPSMFSRSLTVKHQAIHIKDIPALRSKLSKTITFVKKTEQSLLQNFFQLIPQSLKSIPYNSSIYHQLLLQTNQIFQCLGLVLGQSSIMVAQGQKTSSHYVFITNFTYHPLSLCCNQPVVFKRIDKKGVQIQGHTQNVKWQLFCLKCKKILVNIKQNKYQFNSGGVQTFLKKQKLLDFSLHVASGRFKKYRMDQPINQTLQSVKSRVSSLRRYQL